MFVREKVTIIGAGNGGVTAAADLAVKGHDVALYELPQFASNLDEIKVKGGIDLETLPSSDCQSGFGKLALATSDIKEAMAHGDIIIVIVPTYASEAMAKVMAPYVEDRHIIVLSPPNPFGAIYFRKTLMENGCQANVPVCEFDTMPYAVRKTSPSSVWLRGFKFNLGFSCFPSDMIGDKFERCSHLYQLVPRKTELSTCFNNTNNTMHVAIMLCNAAAIEEKEKKLFYRECFTPAAQKLINGMLRERDGVNTIEGLEVPVMEDIHVGWYSHQGLKGDTIIDMYKGLAHFQWSPLPDSLDYRYLTEDVPFGLIPTAEFLEQYGLPHHTISTVIDYTNIITGVDFYKGARTLADCGLKGLTRKELLDLVTHGQY